VQLVLVLVEVADEVLDPALVLKGDAVGRPPLVDQLDLQPAGEEGGLAQPLGQGLEVELDLFFEDLQVREEGDLGAVLLGRGALRQLGDRLAALVVLRPDVAFAADLQVEALGERVDDRDADPVQAARDLVPAAVPELAAGVQTVSTTSAAGRCSFSIVSTGMPRPSSSTVQLLSGCRTTRTLSQCPASASSTELSTTS
jgi:hypothetical protein